MKHVELKTVPWGKFQVTHGHTVHCACCMSKTHEPGYGIPARTPATFTDRTSLLGLCPLLACGSQERLLLKQRNQPAGIGVNMCFLLRCKLSPEEHGFLFSFLLLLHLRQLVTDLPRVEA